MVTDAELLTRAPTGYSDWGLSQL